MYFLGGGHSLSSQLWGLPADICSLPKDPGPCLALFHRWWYDKKNDTCYGFDYGGCQGNNNNFQSKELCLNMCSKKCESQGPQSLILARATGEVWVLASPIWEGYILGGSGADRTSSNQEVRIHLTEGWTVASCKLRLGRDMVMNQSWQV